MAEDQQQQAQFTGTSKRVNEMLMRISFSDPHGDVSVCETRAGKLMRLDHFHYGRQWLIKGITPIKQ